MANLNTKGVKAHRGKQDLKLPDLGRSNGAIGVVAMCEPNSGMVLHSRVGLECP